MAGRAAGLAFAGLALALTALATAAVRFAPALRRTLWPVGADRRVAALVVGADLLTGARLQLNGVVGYSASRSAGTRAWAPSGWVCFSPAR